MIKRTVGARRVGSSLAVLAAVGVMAGCSSSHKASKPKTMPTTAHATTSTSPATTVAPTTTSTPPTTVAAPPTSPTTSAGPPPDAETAARRFFAAWLAHDGAGLNANGTTSAMSAATAQYGKTAGASWQFSNCQGAAGSQYCTWVRAAEDAIVRASDVSPVNRVVEFQWHALEPLDIAEQFLNAWEFGSSSALGVLGTSAAASQAQALSAHRTAGWQSPSSCDGTAGSLYCTFTAGTSKFVVRVGDVELPRQVREVTYTA